MVLILSHNGISNHLGVIPEWASQEVMLALTSSLSCEVWRIWLSWNDKIVRLLHESKPFNVCETGNDDDLQDKWRTMVTYCLSEWERMVQVRTIVGEEEQNKGDHADDEEKDDNGFDD